MCEFHLVEVSYGRWTLWHGNKLVLGMDQRPGAVRPDIPQITYQQWAGIYSSPQEFADSGFAGYLALAD